jgi:hypothetical protein
MRLAHNVKGENGPCSRCEEVCRTHEKQSPQLSKVSDEYYTGLAEKVKGKMAGDVSISGNARNKDRSPPDVLFFTLFLCVTVPAFRWFGSGLALLAR